MPEPIPSLHQTMIDEEEAGDTLMGHLATVVGAAIRDQGTAAPLDVAAHHRIMVKVRATMVELFGIDDDTAPTSPFHLTTAHYARVAAALPAREALIDAVDRLGVAQVQRILNRG